MLRVARLSLLGRFWYIPLKLLVMGLGLVSGDGAEGVGRGEATGGGGAATVLVGEGERRGKEGGRGGCMRREGSMLCLGAGGIASVRKGIR